MKRQLDQPVGVGEVRVGNEEDEHDDVVPSAPPPPLKDMDKIEGYQKFVDPRLNHVPPPPSYTDAIKQPALPPSPPERFTLPPSLSVEEARGRLIHFVSCQSCWGRGAAESMTFVSIISTCAVHYVLRTFLEVRQTDWSHEAFKGQPIDGPQNGQPPKPWDIKISPPDWFDDTEHNLEVPHTASVKICHVCQGACRILCRRCNGWGYRQCYSCSGRGQHGWHSEHSRPTMCYRCTGSGRMRCLSCEGMGRMPCADCDASGRLKYYVNLKVSFQTEEADFIMERTPLPDELIRDVEGQTVFEDTQHALRPLQSFPVPQVNEQSAALIRMHQKLANSGRIWMQRHLIREVPVFECNCLHKRTPFQFFIYGHDRQIYMRDYPDKCCWGCQLL